MDLNFSDERVNTGRQVELDIAKGMAIVFMVFMYSIMVVSLCGLQHITFLVHVKVCLIKTVFVKVDKHCITILIATSIEENVLV